MPPYFKGEPRFDYFERTGFSLAQWKALKARCDEVGIKFISSPFSTEAVELLEQVGVDSFKIPSGEVTNLPMLDVIGRKRKQVLLSSGMSNWAELDVAVETLRRHNSDVVVMQCTSMYPAPNERVGLNVLGEMAERWGLPIGYSDHTLDNHAAFAAVALGALVVEKHLTFSRSMYGSDAVNAAEPAQFRDLVAGIRAISAMRSAPVDKDDLESLRDMKRIFEKSVVSAVAIPAGTVFKRNMLAIRKPGDGIPAAQIDSLIGRKASRDIDAEQLLQDGDIA
jgi:N-acetylneuraminate synthase